MSEMIDLGVIAPQVKPLIRQLRYDLKDDWYPDPYSHEDLLRKENFCEALGAGLERGAGQFKPETRIELDLPKPNFTLRYSLETCLVDRAYYHALATYLFPYYDQLLPQNVLSYRHPTGGSKPSKYLFLNRIEQWNRLHGNIRQELRSKPYLLATDLQNYYENIPLSGLFETLLGRIPSLAADAPTKARIRSAIGDLERCVTSWSYTKDRGLPQNRDASSILANVMLLPVDEAMLRKGYAYFRYMDDIRIATETQFRARAALRDLIFELRKLGLNVNAQKTSILRPGDADYSSLLHPDNELQAIDNMWKSRALPVIRRSVDPLRRLARRLIAEHRMGDRAFRFCIRRFEKLALCANLDVPEEVFAELVDAAIAELEEQPWASDEIIRFIKAAPASSAQVSRAADLLVDSERALYDWQNYLLWQLMVYKGHSEPRLLRAARQRSEVSDLYADRAGAILYMGALGEEYDRLRIAERFSSFKGHLLQRAALVAIHELDFEPMVKEKVKPHVLPSLHGTYARIREEYCGRYCLPLPRTHAGDIYDELSTYD